MENESALGTISLAEESFGAGESTKGRADARSRLAAFKAKKLKLNMSRGQPSPEQLNLSNELLSILSASDFTSRDGLDCRNYPGGVFGLPEAREFFANILEVPAEQVLVGNNASIEIMQNLLSWAMLRGLPGGKGSWVSQAPVKFLCPAPGYDRHFTMTDALGIEMIAVPMTEDGPDMEVVRRLVESDEAVKGIWCVPRYSNPTGATYSDEVVDGLAQMKTAAVDFRIFWDNAYAVHHLVDNPVPLKSIYAACAATGNEDRVYLFGSTSKITFAGAGVCFFGASPRNMEHYAKLLGTQTIGPDKIDQLRHVKYFQSIPGGLPALMKRHAAILRPKFAAALEVLERELGQTDLATWTRPEGGYFISLDTKPGMAKKVVALAAEHGVVLTGAGATYPYGKDPEDRNIRLAPSRPSIDEVKTAMEIVALCIKVVAAD